jgi:hypothetical protein
VRRIVVIAIAGAAALAAVVACGDILSDEPNTPNADGGDDGAADIVIPNQDDARPDTTDGTTGGCVPADCLGGACVDSVCQPVVVRAASGEVLGRIAAFNGKLVAATTKPDVIICTSAKCTSVPSKVSAPALYVAIDGAHAAWSTTFSNGSGTLSGQLGIATLDPPQAIDRLLPTYALRGVALDASDIVKVDIGHNTFGRAADRCPKQGGSCKSVVSDRVFLGLLAAHAGTTYLSAPGKVTGTTIIECPSKTDGGPPSCVDRDILLVTTITDLTASAMGAFLVAAAPATQQGVWQIDTAAKVVRRAPDAARSVAADANSVYWNTVDKIFRLTADDIAKGNAPSVVVEAKDSQWIAVDEQAIYWTDKDNAIWKRAK